MFQEFSHGRADCIEHRRERSAAILRRLESGDATIPEIVEAVYVDVSSGLHGAAGLSVLAHLIELAGLGQVECDGPPAMGRHYRLPRGPRVGRRPESTKEPSRGTPK